MLRHDLWTQLIFVSNIKTFVLNIKGTVFLNYIGGGKLKRTQKKRIKLGLAYLHYFPQKIKPVRGLHRLFKKRASIV